ncbi:MAG: hypothetical protein AB2462_11720 [Thermoanaerobacter sp.]|uniref:hypothetical protein n=1 Tax=Thermoanaerobacter sp. TaxID=1755 RepID=UPI00346389ED
MVKIVIPDNKERIQKQIEALKYLIDEVDTDEKSKQIHQEALQDLQKALRNWLCKVNMKK